MTLTDVGRKFCIALVSDGAVILIALLFTGGKRSERPHGFILRSDHENGSIEIASGAAIFVAALSVQTARRCG